MAEAAAQLFGGARVAGAGGGKGGGGGTELPDSLRSTQVADVLDLLSEGEVEGLARGMKSVFLDGVPLENEDGSLNFTGVQLQFTPGTQGQPAIAGSDGVQNEVAVGVPVTAAAVIVRTITNTDIDTARVTIEVPQLTSQNPDNGDLAGSSFEWAIDLQSAGGGYVQVKSDIVEGKTMGRYHRSIEFPLTGSAPWDIRVRRVSADSGSAAVVNAFNWATYTEVQSLKLRYPNSALSRLRVNAQQFSRIPVRAFDLLGIRVRVPTNYDPTARTYSGVWDGTFKIAWTDNPAWIWFELVTNPRWGCGRYFAVTEEHKWLLYPIGQYCDELVDDGLGGQEARFRCGVYLTTREQAYKVLTDMAAIFRGIAYWANQDLMVMQDAPAAPVAQFTAANVLDGKFTYSSASNGKRHSQVVVWWNNPRDFGRLVPETVVDTQLQKRVGIRSIDISPLGCWSRGQAQRLGKWYLYSEQYENELVGFGVGLDGTLVAPGQVFEIADPNEQGERLGGRIQAATPTLVTLDAEVELASGESYTLTVMLPDPADPARLKPEERAVTTVAGKVSAVAVSAAFSDAPPAGAVWVLKSTGITATVWKCMNARAVEGTNNFEIAGLRHYPGKFALVEQGTAFEPLSVSRIRALAPMPTGLGIVETVYSIASTRRIRATVSWDEPAAGLQYEVAWRQNGGAWTNLASTWSNSVDIDALTPGLLEVTVRSRNSRGSASRTAAASFALVGDEVRNVIHLTPNVAGGTFPKSSGHTRMLLDGVVFTPAAAGVAEIVVTADAYASGAVGSEWGGSSLNVACIRTADLIPHPLGSDGGTIWAPNSTTVWNAGVKAGNGAANARATYTLTARFDVVAGVQYRAGCGIRGQSPDFGISFVMNVAAAPTTHVTLFR